MMTMTSGSACSALLHQDVLDQHRGVLAAVGGRLEHGQQLLLLDQLDRVLLLLEELAQRPVEDLSASFS